MIVALRRVKNHTKNILDTQAVLDDPEAVPDDPIKRLSIIPSPED